MKAINTPTPIPASIEVTHLFVWILASFFQALSKLKHIKVDWLSCVHTWVAERFLWLSSKIIWISSKSRLTFLSSSSISLVCPSTFLSSEEMLWRNQSEWKYLFGAHCFHSIFLVALPKKENKDNSSYSLNKLEEVWILCNFFHYLISFLLVHLPNHSRIVWSDFKTKTENFFWLITVNLPMLSLVCLQVVFLRFFRRSNHRLIVPTQN